jgi:hypothetical protein
MCVNLDGWNGKPSFSLPRLRGVLANGHRLQYWIRPCRTSETFLHVEAAESRNSSSCRPSGWRRHVLGPGTVPFSQSQISFFGFFFKFAGTLNSRFVDLLVIRPTTVSFSLY